MDLNEQLKGWLMQQAQPGSFLDKVGLGLVQAGQTIGQDAAVGSSVLNDPRNSWIRVRVWYGNPRRSRPETGRTGWRWLVRRM